MEATQLASSRESLSLDAWYDAVVRFSEDRDVPLIPLGRFGIYHDDDGLLNSSLLTELPSGAEASPYFDRD